MVIEIIVFVKFVEKIKNEKCNREIKMKEIEADIFEFFNKTNTWIILPTNGCIKKDGSLVMGKGLALGAKIRAQYLPYEIGTLVKLHGNHAYTVNGYNIFTCPTKEDWKDKSDLKLIERSLIELKKCIDDFKILLTKFNRENITIFCPKLGCGEGGLKWEDVKPLIEKYIGEEVIIVSQKEEKLKEFNL